MSGPWEDYGGESGPWSDYQKSATREAVKEGVQEAINDHQGVSWVIDSLRGIKHGGARLVDNLENNMRSGDAWLRQQLGLGDGTYTPINWTGVTTAPVTMTGKVASYVPDLAFALATGGGGEALALKTAGEAALDSLWGRLAVRAAGNAAGSVGWQAADSGSVDGMQTAGDVVLGEAFSHLPKAWRMVRDMTGGRLAPSIARLLGNASIAPKAGVEEAAKAVGVTPLPSTLTQSAAILSIEDVLSRVPGSAGMMRDSRHAYDEAINTFTDNIMKKAGRTGETTALGGDIRRGVEGYVKDFKAESEALYDKVWQKVPRDMAAKVPATRDFISQVDKKFSSNPELKKVLGDKKLAAIYSAIKGERISGAERDELEDLIYTLTGEKGGVLNSPRLTFDDVKNLRTLVGESIKNPNILAPGMLESERKALYGALSEDLEGMVNRAGAGDEWSAATKHYEQGMQVIDKHLQGIVNKKDEDAIYTALFGSNGKEPVAMGAQQAKALLSSLPERVRNQVVGEVVYRMGKPRPGAGVDGFNMPAFSTRYRALTEEAKNALFNPEQRKGLDSLAVLAQAEKSMSGFKNHSGTGAFNATVNMLGRLTSDPVAGALSMMTNFGGSRAIARLILDPRFAEWLTQPVKVGVEEALLGHLGKLVAMYHTRQELQSDISILANEEASKEK